MRKLIQSTSAGLLFFYALCALVAGAFLLLQVDPHRTLVDLIAESKANSYADALKFQGLFFIAAFVVLELLVIRLQGRRNQYDWRDSAASLGIYLINVFTAPLTLLYMYSVLKFAEQYAWFEIGDGLIPMLITFVLFEGAYYWYHRLSHEIPLLWSIHHTHHSAQTMNLSIAFRLHTFGRLVSPLIYLPMILLGFKPEYILIGLSLSLIYQFFIHTQTVPHLGWFERLGLNTPSKHRVHHGTNEYCIDKNYGGTLMIWDYLHGTYAPEGEPIKFGVTSGHYSYNPLVIMFKPQWDWLRGEFHREREQYDTRSAGDQFIAGSYFQRTTAYIGARLVALQTSRRNTNRENDHLEF